MGLISLTLPNDGETIDAADVNSPLNTISTAINGNLDNANIKSGAAIDGSKIADNSIPNTKMINAPLGWTALANTPNTVTANGNRNYDLVFNSVDLSSTLSPGMKLQLTRTVAAPDQCTDLEAGSSQYYSKTSPAGMTFTDDFTCSAWIKLESYGSQSRIIGRISGTNGWHFGITSAGLIYIEIQPGAGTTRSVTSYASVPLNKWVHVAASMDASGGSTLMYLDGLLISSTSTGAATSLTQGGDLQVGAAGTTGYFDGKLAQVAVYNAVLSATTIKNSMDRTLSGSETSLVSAYSFDNSINDLNANANNLTAQGSAVATATDSPFANAVAAGLLEYAEINSVTFSTNTTVNVRVPDTCQIPTTGGVSAVSYSTQSNPYGLPALGNVIGETLVFSDQVTNFNSAVADINGLTTTVYVPTGRSIRFVLHLVVGTATTGTFHIGYIYEGSTQLVVTGFQETSTSLRGELNINSVWRPSSGSHTYKASLYTNQNANTTIYGAIGSAGGMILRVELV